jgi:prepilin-type N-terminal cleavage/methylation domain-containing protein
MSAPIPDRRPPGFTLIELMIASAVGLVILVAAVAAFDLQDRFSRNTERLLGSQATTGMGLTMMQRDLENAGLRFRGGVKTAGGAPYAAVVRAYDNLGVAGGITTLVSAPSGASPVVAQAGTAAGFITGTDAFEVLQGSSVASTQRLGAQVSAITVLTPNTRNIVVAPNPFVPAELLGATVGNVDTAAVLMFWKDDVHCIARVTAIVDPGTAASATVTISNVDSNLAASGTAFGGGCPAFGQNVEVLENRRRYLIYQSDNSDPTKPGRLGLHVQANPSCNPVTTLAPCSMKLDPPRMIAEGVDDMQIAWRVPPAYSPPLTPPIDQGWCQLNIADPTCGFEQPTAVDDAVIGERMASIIGAQIYVASRGPEVLHRPNEPVPVLLNHVPNPPNDGIVRSIMQASVVFRNMVNP